MNERVIIIGKTMGSKDFTGLDGVPSGLQIRGGCREIGVKLDETIA
jgi:hypothetical protein